MKNFILNKKYLWANILLMICTYGIWIVIYFYLRYKYINTSNNLKTWTTKVAGVTFKNDDGTSRQHLIKKLSVNKELKLVPYKYENRDAVYVETIDNKILGNIPKENTVEVCNKLKNNLIKKVSVHKIDSFINENNKKVYYLIIKLYIKKG